MTTTSAENTRPTPVTVLGLGPMGRAIASAFLDARHPVTVWNRTPGRAGDLPGRGAAEAGSVHDAVLAGQVIIVCLLDYDAVRATLEHAPADWANRRLINLTSGEPAQARRMSQSAAARGIDYLDGAILTPTPAMGTPAAAVLLSGARDVYESVQGTMAAVGAAPLYLGDDPGRASAYEIALLDVFATSVSGIVHAFALASAEGIEPERFAAFATGIGGLLPELITRFAQQLQSGRFPGDRSTIASAASGIAHVISTAAGHGIDVGVLAAAKSITDQAIADGCGPDGLARLATVLHKTGRV
ncbi:NAD(P)-binding domain-containing protein [Streptomyces sp. NPDC005435]|uniref:NAD(P)-dependent oxidoreductase n=1 Tax=Streptomyces sp. NPDC005435 TaxID=3154464 RepID=UPI003455472C